MAWASATDFTASGIFDNGAALSGTIAIDTASGVALGGDLFISGNPAAFTTLKLQRTWPPSSPFLYELEFENGQAADNLLTFLFPPVSLVGYAGGVLCGSSPAVCQDQTLTYFSNLGTESGGFVSNFIELTSGSLTPAAVPEPSTSLMLLGAAFLLFAGRRRCRSMFHRRPCQER
jgi:hypothetical protein